MCGETRDFRNYVEGPFWVDFSVGLRSGVDSLRIEGQDGDDDERTEGDEEDSA